ncbi:MAG: tRNA 2-thiouridine(34) synthase MnmA [Thermodesulfobacteriota bacterium]|nr:tRNA 2-thiouridine(34) synthase MnmA [Thermodesulfobacteriota bacterium]
MSGKVAVLVSGGVDSLVAACLLKERHADVVGIHFRTGYHDLSDDSVGALCRQLAIPVHVFDCNVAFKQKVIDYFVQAYLRGETPNPCAICNKRIKFGEAMAYAGQLGADTIATGHYCRVVTAEASVRLLKGADSQKEQSYFLALLTPDQLGRTCFPVGDMTKKAVQAFAESHCLFPVTTKESQDICFIQSDAYAAFIQAHAGIAPGPGPIEDMQGNRIGEHTGIHRFTVGQRRGINCPAEKPYYVAAIDAARNTLKVGFREELMTAVFRVRHVNWLQDPRREMKVKVRYRHPAVPADVTFPATDEVRVDFKIPQFGIAPGQVAVFYEGDTVVGGGIIL